MASLSRRLGNRATSLYLRSWGSRLHGPSFTYKSLEAIRVRRLMRELGCKDPAFAIDAKDDTNAWAVRLGVRTPQLLQLLDDVHDIDWSVLPDRVALKPVKGTASVGVYLLARQGRTWTDLLSGRVLAGHEILREIDALIASGSASRSFLLEELVEDPRCPGEQPIDYKVSTFFGRVGIVEAKAHIGDGRGGRTASWRVFDESWHDVGNVFLENEYDRTIPPPVHGDALLEVARRVSAAIPRPYLRVDLFDDAEGPVLGEVTPEPGNPACMTARMDRKLGICWEDAEARLRVRAARAGLLTPMDEPQPEAMLRIDT